MNISMPINTQFHHDMVSLPLAMGVRKCQVAGCSSREGGVVTLHCFPSDAALKQAWEEYVAWTKRVPLYTSCSNHRVCALHFPASYYKPGNLLDYTVAVPCLAPSRDPVQEAPTVQLITKQQCDVCLINLYIFFY